MYKTKRLWNMKNRSEWKGLTSGFTLLGCHQSIKLPFNFLGQTNKAKGACVLEGYQIQVMAAN
jgi:hypothetical protein